MELIGSGRHCDVFAVAPGRVLRRYRSGQDAGVEAAAMRHVRNHGYPVPEVFDADGPDMVMARVDGPSMLQVMARRPHRLPGLARVLADLHRRLHAIPAFDALERPFGDAGDVVLHMDLQPANVVMSVDGPVVLDWGWVAAGPGEADEAHTWLTMATSEVPASAVIRTLALVGRGVVVREFLRQCDRARLVQMMPAVAHDHLTRHALTDREREVIARFVKRVGGGRGPRR